MRWIRDDRIGLEFAHETQIDCAPEERDALLLDVIRRSFPDEVAPSTASRAGRSPPAERRRRRRSRERRRTERRHPLIWIGRRSTYNHGSDKVRLRNISETWRADRMPDRLPARRRNAARPRRCRPAFRDRQLDLRRQGRPEVPARRSTSSCSASRKPELAPAMMTRPGPSHDLSPIRTIPWAEGLGAASRSTSFATTSKAISSASTSLVQDQAGTSSSRASST